MVYGNHFGSPNRTYHNVGTISVKSYISRLAMALGDGRTLRHHHICERLTNNIASTDDSDVLTFEFYVVILQEVHYPGCGAGFDTSTWQEDRKHVGLRNIRERLKVMVNGTLEIESTVGVGTKVLITIPKEVQK